MSLHTATAFAADDLGTTDTVEKIFTPEIPLADLIAPMILLNAPIMGEEVISHFPELEDNSELTNYSFLSSDLSPPTIQ